MSKNKQIEAKKILTIIQHQMDKIKEEVDLHEKYDAEIDWLQEDIHTCIKKQYEFSEKWGRRPTNSRIRDKAKDVRKLLIELIELYD